MSKKDKYTFSSKGFSMSNENTSSSSVNVTSSIPENTSSAVVTPAASASSKVAIPKKSVVPASMRATVTTMKQAPVTSNPSNVDKLQTLIQKYESALKEKSETITSWINLCNYLNRTNDPKVFQVFYVWFAKHLKDYTSADVALAGVHTIQNANTKVRVGSTHQCFEELVRVLSSRNSHFRFTVKAMQGMAISDTLARWFFTKTTK